MLNLTLLAVFFLPPANNRGGAFDSPGVTSWLLLEEAVPAAALLCLLSLFPFLGCSSDQGTYCSSSSCSESSLVLEVCPGLSLFLDDDGRGTYSSSLVSSSSLSSSFPSSCTISGSSLLSSAGLILKASSSFLLSSALVGLVSASLSVIS